MSTAEDVGSLLRAAREDAGLSLTRMAQLTHYSKPYLGLVETGRRPATVDIVVAYERELGPIGDDMLKRRDITHPRVMKLDRPTLTELARSIDSGDPGSLANTPSSRNVDFFLAAKLNQSGADHLREWARAGSSVTLRTNAIAVLSKMAHPEDTGLIIDVLERDEKVRYLSLASEVSKLAQHEWEVCLTVAKDPTKAPEPRKLAKALGKEVMLEKDAESRWCGAHLLTGLVPVLGR
ncbi:Helix-turn-helix domain-containing protein [Actinopolyspora alba]|uniref:Helix-turn-helix domain-containing protein n=1 Tax=Actinopolyspora alba TaxID=673379 RepID=A0A1I2A770_9ACTN|nr:Helix-turn-helix domain-containing protein [Actinopolyspora alba]